LQDDFAERVASLRNSQQQSSNRISAMAGNLEALENKAAERGEVMHLKDGLAKVSQNLRDKEATVLFGARCLSCNRVFDDVRVEPNAVDLQQERQRQQVFAEVQRVLNDPAADFSKPVKMVSVKVGKPGVSRSNMDGTGSFHTRDQGFGNPLEDMHLVLQGNNRQDSLERARTADATSVMQSPKSFFGHSGAKESKSDYRQSVTSLVGRKAVPVHLASPR